MRLVPIVAATLLLGGCGGAPVAAPRLAEVERLIRAEFAPAPAPALVASWRPDIEGSDLVCGELDAPPALRDSRSTIRFVSFDRNLALEPHLVTADPLSAQIAAESVSIFDSTWAEHCAVAAPLGRRVAGWFSWGKPDRRATPLTDAAADQLLNGPDARR